MASKRTISRRFLALVFLSAVSLAAGTETYLISHNQEKITVSFATAWAFDEIRLPAVSPALWGSSMRCRAATIRIGDFYSVAAQTGSSSYLVFTVPGVSSESVCITPLVMEPAAADTAEGRLHFSAVPATRRRIENDLDAAIDSVIAFQRQHSCFSCHTALPAALACKTAAARGYRINREKVRQLASQITGMQQDNGIFFFAAHPDYGPITTTLCAGAILALLSDFSADYLHNLRKIYDLLPNWQDKDGFIRSDFYFRPLFIGQITSALFETLIISSLYAGSAEESGSDETTRYRERLLRMNAWGRAQTSEPIHRRIILMAGMPYLFQFADADRPEIISQLKRLCENEPEGKRADIKALVSYISHRIAPEEVLTDSRELFPHSLSEKLWDCLYRMTIISSFRAKNSRDSADKAK